MKIRIFFQRMIQITNLKLLEKKWSESLIPIQNHWISIFNSNSNCPAMGTNSQKIDQIINPNTYSKKKIRITNRNPNLLDLNRQGQGFEHCSSLCTEKLWILQYWKKKRMYSRPMRNWEPDSLIKSVPQWG